MATTQMAAAFSPEAHCGPVEHSRHFLNTCFRGKKRKSSFCKDLHPQQYSKLNFTIPWATQSNFKAWSNCKFGTALIRSLYQVSLKILSKLSFYLIINISWILSVPFLNFKREKYRKESRYYCLNLSFTITQSNPTFPMLSNQPTSISGDWFFCISIMTFS